MLHVDHLQAGYGQSRVLHGVSFEVAAGEIVALLGRNGAGRSTLAKALMGLLPSSGCVRWHDQEIGEKKTFERARLGLGYVPESRDVFPGLTVAQNLRLGQKENRQSGRWTLAEMYQLFPPLLARQHTPAGVLSGGEQQMLALCRCLMGDPALLLLDEPTEGLAPQMVARVAQFLQALQQKGVAVLLIEQKMNLALEVADRCLVMGQGRIVYSGTPAQLRQASAVQQEWLALGGENTRTAPAGLQRKKTP